MKEKKMARQSKAARTLDAKVNAICQRALERVPVSIMDLHKVSTAARNALASGDADDVVFTKARAMAVSLSKETA
jgi:hypothetical protein